VGDRPDEWVAADSAVAGACIACGRQQGLVLVRNGIRLCFTCAMDAGRAAVTATGFLRPKRGDRKEGS
jgi:hypothetical protein